VDPRLRTALVTVAASVLAVLLALELAQGFFFWPTLTCAMVAGAILIRLLALPADTIFLGLILIGYLVGNRGFAQLMPAPGVPLLPAEAALILGCSWRLIQCAFKRELPFRLDALNWAVLAWLVIGTVRVAFDVPRYGINAIRDYAVCYYAVFFFLAQHMAARADARRYLVGCLLVGVIVMGPLFALFQFFERLFLSSLIVAGVPLIYYKADLAATHLAAGALILFHWAPPRQRWWAWTASIGVTLFLLAFDSRASLLGALVAGGLLLLAGRWKFPAMQGFAAGVALTVVILLGVVFNNAWAGRKLDGIRDRVASVVDFTGQQRYESQESSFKGDNNRFRVVWWRNVVEETVAANPVFGQGFGADLSRGFVQEYFPTGGEDFTARSPHSILMTAFGRLGAVGAAAWVGFCVVLLARTWRSLRHAEDPVTWSLWCGAWVILVSGTFGVVLEGPMGAVIFWTLLGLAAAAPAPADEPAVVPPATARLVTADTAAP
jgi:hypothetical protein